METQENLTNVTLISFSDMLASYLTESRDSLWQVLYNPIRHIDRYIPA
jgi:hypothetical protein